MADTLPTWKDLGRMSAEDPVGLRDLAWRLCSELETARAVAQGNKRHVAALTEAYEELETRALAPDARERLARHLFVTYGTTGMTPDHAARIWESRRIGREGWLARADDAFTEITGKDN